MNKEIFQFQNDSSKQILNKIRLQGEISSAELSRITSYQPSTISNIVKKLQNRGLIEVSRIANSDSVGKPPTLWKIKSDQGYIIGIECLPNEIRSRIIDFAGNSIAQKRRKYKHLIKGRKITQKINSYIENILNEFEYLRNDILGIGVALPGLVVSEKGYIPYSRELNIDQIPLRKKIKENFDFPFYISNDANAGALGEIWFKSSEKQTNLVFLTINEITKDLGSGIIINNQLYDGHSGTAGELLTRLPNIIDIISRIKKEDKISTHFWDRFNKHKEVPFSEIIKRAKQEDPVASVIVREFSDVIAEQIVNLIGFLNPQSIILGGDISSTDYIVNNYILPEVKDNFSKLFPRGVEFPNITPSKFGIYSVSMGAISLIFKDILSAGQE